MKTCNTSKLFFVLIIFFLSITNQHFSQSAANIGFENGDFTGWEGGIGNCCPINITTIGMFPGRHTIMSGMSMSPNTCGNLPVVCPSGDIYSARLGNNNDGHKAERLSYTYTVTPTTNLLIYKYAVVLEDPGHDISDQPRFEISILDASGNLIDPLCGYYKVIAQQGLPGWQNCGSVVYSEWTTIGVDLSALVGQNITVQFQTGDCDLGGHYGYAYIDSEVTSLDLEVIYCMGVNSVTLSAPEGFTYLWDNGETTQSTTIPLPASTPTMGLTMTAVTGCEVHLSADLNANLFNQGFLANISCSGQVIFTDTLNRSNHEWDFGDGTIISGNPSPTHIYTSPGYYDVTLISVTSLGCRDTITQEIYVPAIPQADFTFTDQCLNESVQFTDQSSSTIPITIWKWSFGDGQTSTSQNPVHSYASEGIYNVELELTNQDGCSNTINYNVEVYPLANISFSTIDVCLNEPNSFSNSTTISSGSLNYNWDFGDGTHAGGFEPNHTYLTDGSYTVILEATSNHGCITSNQIMLIIHPLPEISFTAQDVCFNQATPFNNTSSINSGTINSWNWNFGDGNNSTSYQPSHTYTAPGNYTVTLEGTSNHNCISSNQIVVNVNLLPNVFAGNEQAHCNYGDPVILCGSGAVTYSWDHGVSDCIGFNQPVGTITYTVTGTDANGCINTDQVGVTIHPLPNISFSTPNECLNEPNCFTNTSSIISGTIDNWDWDFGDGIHDGSFEPCHIYAADGSYTVTLTVNSNHGCVDSDQINVTIYPLPVVDFIVEDHCHLEVAYFENLSTISSGSLSYNWDLDDGTQFSLENFNYQYTDPGTYNITLTATSNHNCIISQSKFLTVHPNPEIEFSANPLTGCTPLEVKLLDESDIISGSIDVWEWIVDGTVYFGPTQTITLTEPTLYDVQLTLISNQGCSSKIINHDYIEVYPLPIAGFNTSTVETSIISPKVTVSDLSSGSDYIEWNWGDFNYESSFPEEEIFHFYNEIGSYVIEQVVFNNYGCSDTSYQEINIEDTLLVYIPNTFTPDGDGVNDLFKVIGSDLYNKDFIFTIFNRWGEIVFEGHTPDEGWDGTFRGNYCPIGTYVYQLVLKNEGENNVYNGFAVLIR